MHEQVDQFSDETFPYQQNNVVGGAEINSQMEDTGPDFANQMNQRSQTVEASMRGERKVYKMPLSKQIGRHVYGGKDPGSQVALKRSLQGEGPVKLEKLNHEIRIRQADTAGATGGNSAKRGVRASLPPLQTQSDKLSKRVTGARMQPNR